MGPEYKRYIWWKKYLTSMQMVQFVMIFVHGLAPLLVQKCEFPIVYSYLLMGEALLFLGLFSQFYVKSYNTNKPVKKVGRMQLKAEMWFYMRVIGIRMS